MNKIAFKTWVKEKIISYPKLSSEIEDFYWLAISEIAEGGSETHEINLAVNSIEELIEESVEVDWNVAKNHQHDISGIFNHENYMYKKESGIYFPTTKK